jgi:EAL domain-containing protein (putative c-di-GMP-specific phosphodiesterase class I)
VELATGAPTGVEALLRWTDPVLGRVSPADFIPVAEEWELISVLGGWVLETACREIAAAHPTLGVSVNVSGHQLASSRFADEVAAALSGAGLTAARLTLELTETALVRDIRRARRVLGELRARGVHVAIDDFGAGYSSLAYLQQLPLDVLKLDKTYIDSLARSRGGPSVAVPRAMVALGHALGLRTVGEGVETAGQRDALQALGCDRGQGYYFARPMPAAELGGWLAAAAGASPTDG